MTRYCPKINEKLRSDIEKEREGIERGEMENGYIMEKWDILLEWAL